MAEITTKDGLIHQGFHMPGTGKDIPAVLWIHALGNAFYHGSERHAAFMDACAVEGYGYASFNTRGHDLLASSKIRENGILTGKRKMIGSSVERFAECTADIDASVSFLASRGYRKIILVGYSTGANKACYYAATAGDSRISGVVLISPLNDRLGMQKMPGFHSMLARMKTEKDAGRGDVLDPSAAPFPMTPNRFLSLAGTGSDEDVFDYDRPDGLKPFSAIRLPVCVVLAGADEHADRPTEEIRKAFDLHVQSSSYESIIVAGADHGFTGMETKLAQSVIRWAGENFRVLA